MMVESSTKEVQPKRRMPRKKAPAAVFQKADDSAAGEGNTAAVPTPSKAPEKKAPTKKAAVPSKKPTKKAATGAPPTKKKVTPPAKPQKRTTAKTTPAKATAKKERAPRTDNREYGEHGFVNGSDSAVIAEALVKGGESRIWLNEHIAGLIGNETRNGTSKNVPALVSGIIGRLKKQGYTTESTFRMIPPAKKA